LTGVGYDAELAAQRDSLQSLQDLPEHIGIRITVREGDPDPADTELDVCADLE
jgi:hypothetical protein